MFSNSISVSLRSCNKVNTFRVGKPTIYIFKPCSNPTNKFMRQILGSVAELEKTSLVEKLKSARDKKREETGKCEGRKSLWETHPDVIKFAKDLYRKPKGSKRKSLMKIAIELENNKMVTSKGNRYSASSVKRMVEW